MFSRRARTRALTTALVATALVTASLLVAAEPPGARAQSAEPGLRVYNVVLDGLMPREVTPTLMPNLTRLKSQGTWYEQARAVFPAETIPNHAAMMTGVQPARSGIIGNDYWLKGAGSGQPQRSRMANPNLLGADTTTTRLENSCEISTATVQSKGYLWGLLRGEPPEGNPANTYPFDGQENADHPTDQRQADYHPNPNSFPGYIIDPDDHTLDQSIMNLGFRPWIESNPPTPHFAFVNLGDIDRSGHIDQSGAFTSGGLTAARQAALIDTDALIGQLVDDLVAAGAWDETVLIFTSDHSMDWGTQDKDVSAGLHSALTAQGYRSDPGEPGPGPNGPGGDYYEVAGGGTSALYVEEPEDVADVARIAAESPGVAVVATRSVPTGLPASLQSKVVPLDQVGMDHPKYGADVVVMAEPGWAFRSGNPLPGNHGHPVTQPSVLLVAGGHPVVDDQPESVSGETVFDPGTRPFASPAGGPGNLSVAPTVAALFGLGEPAGGYDGAPLAAAFEDYAFLPHQPCEAASPPPDLAADTTDQPDPVRRNSTLIYTVAVENRGMSGATGVTLRDVLPDTVRLRTARSTQGSCSASGRTVECALGAIAAGARATVTIEVRADRTGTITNRATATGNEPEVNRDNNESLESTTVLPGSG